MFKELETLIRELEVKANKVHDHQEEFSGWLKHPITESMFADLKHKYLLSVNDESLKAERSLLEEIFVKWGEEPDED